MSEGHAATRAVLMQVACATTRAMVMSGTELLLRAMYGPMILLQLGSVMMSVACVTQEVIGTMLC